MQQFTTVADEKNFTQKHLWEIKKLLNHVGFAPVPFLMLLPSRLAANALLETNKLK